MVKARFCSGQAMSGVCRVRARTLEGLGAEVWRPKRVVLLERMQLWKE